MALFGLIPDKQLDDYVDRLPTGNITVRALQTLDFVAPGEWTNPHNFDRLLQEITRESDPAFLADVKKRANELFDDKNEGYQKAFKIYQRVDSSDKLFGTAALADKIGGSVKFLSFLDKITPAADTTQTIDLSVKLLSELLAFVKVNGIPGDGIGDFAKALGEYSKASKIRLAALIAFDGLVPLGPDFLVKCSETVARLTKDKLEGSPVFRRIKEFIPEGRRPEEFVKEAYGAAESQLQKFTTDHAMTREGITSRLKGFIDFTDDKLDYLGAFLDMTTNYYEHTGLQSIATRVIERAVNEA